MAVKAAADPGERRVLDLAAGGVHDQVGDEQEDRDGACQEHGGERATRRPARGSHLPHEQDAGDHEDSDDETARGRFEERRNGVQANDAKRVCRTLRAPVVPARVPHENPSGTRTSQAQYTPTTNRRSRLVSSRPLGNARKRCTVITSSRFAERREHRVGEGRVPVELSRGNRETERDHEQSDTVPRTAMQGNEPGGDPDAGVHDHATTVPRAVRLEVVGDPHELLGKGDEHQPGNGQRDEQAATHPGAPATLASAAAERSSL